MFHNPNVEGSHTSNPQRRYELKQVEVNTIAAAGAAESTKLTQMHKGALEQWSGYMDFSDGYLPENDAVGLVVDGLVSAWAAYGIFETRVYQVNSRVSPTGILSLNIKLIDETHIDLEQRKMK